MVMDSWRSSHAFPLNTMQVTLRNRSARVNSASQVVQRLKRAPSVVAKLRRYSGMSLSRMQDLGGCRSIVSKVNEVFEIRDLYQSSRDRHKLATIKDYIENPQDSGYRGVHLVYRYESERTNKYNGHRIEIQLRTATQHAWATAVEIAGVYVRSPLKSSIGPGEWLQFFRLTSAVFSGLEGTTPVTGTQNEKDVITALRKINSQLGAIQKLRTFNTAHSHIASNRRKSDSHFILTLDLRNRRSTIEAFSAIAPAAERYAALEQECLEDPLIDIVLVAAENVDAAAMAYPNYFGDTRQFLALVEMALNR